MFEDDVSAEDTEQKLEYTAAHEEYCELFEGYIEQIIEKVRPGTTSEEFGEVITTTENGGFALHMLTAVADYKNFVDLMREYKRTGGLGDLA